MVQVEKEDRDLNVFVSLWYPYRKFKQPEGKPLNVMAGVKYYCMILKKKKMLMLNALKRLDLYLPTHFLVPFS